MAEQITFLCLLWLGWVRCVCMEEVRFHSKKKETNFVGKFRPPLNSCTLTCKIDPNFIYSRKIKATMYTVIYPRVYLSRIYAKSNHIIISSAYRRPMEAIYIFGTQYAFEMIINVTTLCVKMLSFTQKPFQNSQ